MSILRNLVGILFLALLTPLAFGAQAEKRRPNIVFILADDLGVNDLSCYGRKDQTTPHLDRLARAGMRFTSAYSAEPVCSPTRAALMTGRDPARLHITTFLPGRPDAPSQLLLQAKVQQQLPLSVKTIAEMLRAAGYATGCFGKWHLGNKGAMPTDRGFDLYFAGKGNTEPSAQEGGKGEYELTAHAEKFIDANKDRPFFLYIAHHTPHIPLKARAELVEKHNDAFNPIYAAMIESMDDCVGRVVAKVESLGLGNDTLIIFTSDNGGLHVLEFALTPATYNAPYRAGKGFLYEGGIRVPLIAYWPGKIRPAIVNTPVITTDWTPTLLELTGVQASEPFDGISLAALLTRGAALAPRPLCWHFPHYTNQGGRPAGAIRAGDWKLVEHYEDGRCELFNLADDIAEANDRAVDQPSRVAELRGQLEKHRRSIGAAENPANPKFNATAWKKIYSDFDLSQLRMEPTAAATAPKIDPWRKLMDAAVAKGAKASTQIQPGAGAVILHARHAKVHGSKLRYEEPPHKDTLGFWTQLDDWAEWEFEAPSAGTFEVEVLQACGKGSGGAEVEVAIAGQKLTMKVMETGHFQRFVPRTAGAITLAEPGRYRLEVRARNKPGPAVMDLRRVVVRAAQ